MIQILLEHGADPLAPNACGASPLELALENRIASESLEAGSSGASARLAYDILEALWSHDGGVQARVAAQGGALMDAAAEGGAAVSAAFLASHGVALGPTEALPQRLLDASV